MEEGALYVACVESMVAKEPRAPGCNVKWTALLAVRVTLPLIVALEVDGVTTNPPFSKAPVPLRVTVCGEPVALSVMESEALSAPPVAGVNTTESVQVAPVATDEQLFV